MFTLLSSIFQSLRFFGCDPNQGAGFFFGLPHWYQYLDGETEGLSGKCIPAIKNINDFWAIALAIVDILLRVGGILAVAYVVYGGFRYVTSQGEPERTTEAKNTLVNAVVGLVIVIFAIVIVNFVGTHIK